MMKVLVIFVFAAAIWGVTLTHQQKIDPTSSSSENGNGQIKVMFFRTADWYKNVIEGKRTRNGRYNERFKIIEHLSHFCLGHDAIIEVRTDDTHFFARGKGAWPSRPELEWFSDALKGDFERIYFIQYQSYPPVFTNDAEDNDNTPNNPLMMCTQNGKNTCKSRVIAHVNLRKEGDDDSDSDKKRRCCDKKNSNTNLTSCKIWCTHDNSNTL